MSHEPTTAKQPSHAGEGHLVENVVVFVVIFGAFLLGIYLLNWLTLETVWPMAAIVVISFLAFFIPQGILGRSATGYNLAEGKQTDEKSTSAADEGLGKNEKYLLRDFNGVLKAGEMALVVGRPGSGCTTFLKVGLRNRPSPATRLPSPSSTFFSPF